MEATTEKPGQGGWRRHERALACVILLAAMVMAAWVFMRTQATGAHAADTYMAAEHGGTGIAVAWTAAFIGMIRWVQSQGLMAAVWLIALQALLVVLAIPGPFFTLAAGFLFGLVGGSVVAVAGSTTGAVVAYWLGHGLHCVRAKRTTDGPSGSRSGWGARLASHPRLYLLARVVRDGGWTVVLSTRLLPLFPFKLSNYFFGWVRFPFAAFFWGTLIGLIPITVVSVSAGALASDLSGLTSPDLTAGDGWVWSLATLGLGLIVLMWAGLRARALYRDALLEEGLTECPAPARAAGGAGRPGFRERGHTAAPGHDGTGDAWGDRSARAGEREEDR